MLSGLARPTPSTRHMQLQPPPSQELFQNVNTFYPPMTLAEQKHLETEFLDAAVNGDLMKVNECIRKGVKVETKEQDSFRAIHYASYHGHLHIVQYLIEQCQVDVNAKINNGLTALHLASQFGHKEIVKYFINDCHVDVTTTTTTNDNDTMWKHFIDRLNQATYV